MDEQLLAEAFVEVADTLVDDFDLLEFLHRVTVRCADVLSVSAAGLLLSDQRGALRMIAASTEETRLLELLEIQTDEGDEASRRYDTRFTPAFVVFDAHGAVVARTTVVGDAAARLRSLVATP